MDIATYRLNPPRPDLEKVPKILKIVWMMNFSKKLQNPMCDKSRLIEENKKNTWGNKSYIIFLFMILNAILSKSKKKISQCLQI